MKDWLSKVWAVSLILTTFLSSVLFGGSGFESDDSLISTFAGDEHRVADFYVKAIADQMKRDVQANQPNPSSDGKSTCGAANPLLRSPQTTQPKYLIITSAALQGAFQPLIDWKREKGLSTGLDLVEDILSNHQGVDGAEKLRNFFIESYSLGTEYVLLGGDETIIPIRYAYHANTSSCPSIDLLQICDLYYADVDGIWDADGDGVYGEPAQDQPNLIADLLIGRLPFHVAEDVSNYIEKLIHYEQSPGAGDFSYLNQSLFIAADQMRDYQGVGQQELIAAVFPPHVTSNLSDLIEAPTGIADNPLTPEAPAAIDELGNGWGILSLLIHGVVDGWVLKSHQYNQWPKSFLFTAEGQDGTHGFLPNVPADGKPGLVYSIGCDNGAFDMDSPPFPSTNPCVAEHFLAKENGGAIGFVGYSRWGWVSTSWKLEKVFMEYLYNTDNNAVAALNYSKELFPYYRDLCYGINYFGDPETGIWIDEPLTLQVTVPDTLSQGAAEFPVVVEAPSEPVAGALVTVTMNDSILTQVTTDKNGVATISINYDWQNDFQIVVYKSKYAVVSKTLTPQIILGVDDDPTLPGTFALNQNYPNPFNPSTQISFSLPKPCQVRLEIFNALGQAIALVENRMVPAGDHCWLWNGKNSRGDEAGSGIYFARLVADEYVGSIKMLLLK